MHVGLQLNSAGEPLAASAFFSSFVRRRRLYLRSLAASTPAESPFHAQPCVVIETNYGWSPSLRMPNRRWFSRMKSTFPDTR